MTTAEQRRVSWLAQQAALELDAAAHEVDYALRLIHKRSAAAFARAAKQMRAEVAP